MSTGTRMPSSAKARMAGAAWSGDRRK
jgi:hypothetical protein